MISHFRRRVLCWGGDFWGAGWLSAKNRSVFCGCLLTLLSVSPACWVFGGPVVDSTVGTGGAYEGVLLDEIVATVGDRVILSSDIVNQIADLQRQGVDVKELSACSVLEQAIAMKAMVLQAIKDSIPVSDEEVDAELERRVRYFLNLYGSKNELEQIAGKTIFQMKEDFGEPIREGLLARGMQQKIMSNVKITPSEVRAFFNAEPQNQRPYYELEMEIAQIVMYPKATKDVEDYVVQELKEYRREVEDHTAKFENLAQMYSDDPGSKNTGGRYEINKNEKQWDPVFLSTAFRLQPGQISQVVKSKFGYHIIQMVSRYGDDAVVRHILRIPQIFPADIEKTRKKMETIRQQILDHQITFEQAVARYTEDESSAFTGGYVLNREQSSLVSIDELDRSIVAHLSELRVGEYSRPIVFEDERGRKGVKMLYLKTKIPAHTESLERDYLKIAARFREKKKAEQLKEWLSKNVSSFYLHVGKSYKHCGGTIANWVADSEKKGSEL